MAAEQVLAFRHSRSGLAERCASLAGAAACPASDFARDAALLALAARADGVTREAYRDAIDRGEIVVAYAPRAAIHVLAPGDFERFGSALVSRDAPGLEEVAAAVRDALSGGRRLDKNELHEELRGRLPTELLPWCRSCESHHVAPMLWRQAAVVAGVRLDSERRHLLAELGPVPPAADALRRFLSFYGPATLRDFAEWAWLEGKRPRPAWDALAGETVELEGGRRLLAADADALASPPEAKGLRLLPPGDPFLQKPNRPLLAPDPALRKRLFRPVARPGAVVLDGRVAGLWKVRGEKVEVEPLRRLPKGALDDEIERVLTART